MTSENLIFNSIRGTNGQSPNQGGALTPGDTQGEKPVSGLRCPECGVKFESLEDLESHVQTDHPEVSPETSSAGKRAEASPAPKVRCEFLDAWDFVLTCYNNATKQNKTKTDTIQLI